jgi:glycolate oxidase FAD binding subunit
MASKLKPGDCQELREAITSAAASGTPLCVSAGGSKSGLGRPVLSEHILDLSRLSGVTCYEPEELVITAQAATPLTIVEETLESAGQEIRFEPADYGPILGAPAGMGTIGGVFACNISGPRRVKSGAARDFLLGAKAVNGRGELFKCGGRVMKNVTGYDLCKLLAGSFGTLAAMTEVTFKVLPRPAETQTILIQGLDPPEAVAAMTEALQSPFEVYGAAHLPGAAAGHSTVDAVKGAGTSVTAVRLEGPAPSVRYCGGRLCDLLGAGREIARLGDAESKVFWRELRDVMPFVPLAGRMIWRLSVTPSKAAETVREIARACDAEAIFDWGGGLVWLAIAEDASADSGTIAPNVRGADAVARTVRGAVAKAGGHALLLRASDAVRARVPVFHPLDVVAAGVTLRLKESFDPGRVLNPGRMYQGI